MARVSNKHDFEAVLAAAQHWIRNCLVDDGSVLSSNHLWQERYIIELRHAFVENPDQGKGDFISKLKGQISGASPDAKRLAGEMLWVLLLFPSKIGAATKRRQISEIWKMSDDDLRQDHPMLSDAVLAGVGGAGPAYSNLRWRELGFLIAVAEDLKRRAAAERNTIVSEYDNFVKWMDDVPQEGKRQFSHMLRFFCFPDRVERMSSNNERRAVLAGFGVAPDKETRNWHDRQLDTALLDLRRKLEQDLPDQSLDFYEPPLRERWKQIEPSEGAVDVTKRPRFWVEKTIVTRRPDRQAGDHAVGRALWSPQRADRNRDIYRLMRDVRPGDVVFHFVDNERVDSYSVVKNAVDESFVGLPGTKWADRPAYRVELRDHTELVPPIDREEFLGEHSEYRPLIRELRDSETGLFFNREFNLNEGSYLTAAPLKLVQIWNDIHLKHTAQPLNPNWDIPPLKSASNLKRRKAPEHMPLLEFAEFTAIDKVIGDLGIRTTAGFLRRLVASLASKPFVILTGTSGTGKTKVALALAHWLSSDSSAYEVVPVGADWTGNDNIIGYPDGLDAGAYVAKPTLELIARAADDPHAPHFLILDEMNLSHVERYFADLLSAMESGEPIPLLGIAPQTLWQGHRTATADPAERLRYRYRQRR